MVKEIESFGHLLRFITPTLIGALGWFMVTSVNEIKASIKEGREETKILRVSQTETEKDVIRIKARCCRKAPVEDDLSQCNICEVHDGKS